MKYLICLIIFIGFMWGNVSAQEEVRMRIKEGMPMIPVACPDFTFTQTSAVDTQIQQEIISTLWNDLQYSRVFKMVPREHYGYIQKFDPNQIVFKDWASIQANVLISGEIELSEGQDRVVLSVKVYDVLSEKFIFGRNFGGKRELIRLISHRVADAMMKYFGEKQYFLSKIVFVSDRDKNNEIYIMDYDGARQTRITFNEALDIMPSWSGDGEKILYTSYKKGGPDLYMFHLYTGKTELISHGGANYSADWSYEGNKIVYTSTKNDKNAEIYVRDMDSAKEKRLTFNQIIDTTPSWSPNGNEIAFISQRSGIPHIYLMDNEGTNVRRITYEGSHHDNPIWSPDGTRIVYVSMVNFQLDLFVFHIKSNQITKITENAGRNENPTWSPDGRHIVFSSNRSGKYQIYSVDYDGTNLTQLTFTSENKMPKWQKK